MTYRPTIGRVVVKLPEQQESALAGTIGDETLWVEVVAVGQPYDHPAEFRAGDIVKLDNLSGSREDTEDGTFLVTAISNVVLVK